MKELLLYIAKNLVDHPEAVTVTEVPGDQELTLELPFDRYYLKENHAPEAEKLYRMSTQRKSAWITVRIKDGEAALDELYIDGKPVGQQLNGSSGK